jgi:hypothetical protein
MALHKITEFYTEWFSVYRNITSKFCTIAIFKKCVKQKVKWVPCHHGMARPQVADGGEDLQIWRVAVNILNKQSRTTDKGWPSSLGVGRGANNSSP